MKNFWFVDFLCRVTQERNINDLKDIGTERNKFLSLPPLIEPSESKSYVDSCIYKI